MEERFALVLCGSLQKSRWLKTETPADFYTIKGIVQSLLETLGFNENRVVFKENTTDISTFPSISECRSLYRQDIVRYFRKDPSEHGEEI